MATHKADSNQTSPLHINFATVFMSTSALKRGRFTDRSWECIGGAAATLSILLSVAIALDLARRKWPWVLGHEPLFPGWLQEPLGLAPSGSSSILDRILRPSRYASGYIVSLMTVGAACFAVLIAFWLRPPRELEPRGEPPQPKAKLLRYSIFSMCFALATGLTAEWIRCNLFMVHLPDTIAMLAVGAVGAFTAIVGMRSLCSIGNGRPTSWLRHRLCFWFGSGLVLIALGCMGHSAGPAASHRAALNEYSCTYRIVTGCLAQYLLEMPWLPFERGQRRDYTSTRYPPADRWMDELSPYLKGGDWRRLLEHDGHAGYGVAFNAKLGGRRVRDVHPTTVLFFASGFAPNVAGGAELAVFDLRAHSGILGRPAGEPVCGVILADKTIRIVPRSEFERLRWDP